MANENKDKAPDFLTPAVDPEVVKVEAANDKTSGDIPRTYEDALQAGYLGTAMSPVPNAVHEAGNEALRAEVYGSAPVPESRDGKDGPFASMQAAKGAVRFSNDLATVSQHPTLRGASVNGAGDSALNKDTK